MIDRFHTRLATLIVTHTARPKLLVIKAWLWLAAEADSLEDKRRCLNAVLALDPTSLSLGGERAGVRVKAQPALILRGGCILSAA